jgi:hypothetical protein
MVLALGKDGNAYLLNRTNLGTVGSPVAQVSGSSIIQAAVGFTAFSSTNVSLPFTSWTRLGFATEVSAGQFQFTDSQAANSSACFYRVRSP